MDTVFLPAKEIPSWSVNQAFQKGFERNFLITTWGGLGDQVCAEPTLRFALKRFDKCTISLATETPDLFDHLDFERVYPYKDLKKLEDSHMVFHTIKNPQSLTWEFMSHCLTNAVDFASLCSFRLQLPIKDKEIKLVHGIFKDPFDIPWDKAVVVHPGKHWPSKTFPKEWWDCVLFDIIDRGGIPVIIGKDTDDNRGTVDVNTNFCVDLRNKTSIKEMIYVLQKTKVLISNDSSPIHIAASGSAWIGFIASCKHPDYISHWRNGQWSWRMQNLGRDGMWNYVDHNPCQKSDIKVDEISDDLMRKILPTPMVVASWAIDKLQ